MILGWQRYQLYKTIKLELHTHLTGARSSQIYDNTIESRKTLEVHMEDICNDLIFISILGIQDPSTTFRNKGSR